jgi:hypothetical protein
MQRHHLYIVVHASKAANAAYATYAYRAKHGIVNNDMV